MAASGVGQDGKVEKERPVLSVPFSRGDDCRRQSQRCHDVRGREEEGVSSGVMWMSMGISSHSRSSLLIDDYWRSQKIDCIDQREISRS